MALRAAAGACASLALAPAPAGASGHGAPAGHAARARVAHRASAAPALTIPVDVGASPRGRPLPAGFVGLALEYRSVPSLAGGRAAASVDPVLVALVRALDPTGGTVLRIGGQSADRSWWPVPGMSRPPGITYDLTPAWVASAAALTQALDARLILGLGLEADDPRIDAVQARNLLAGLGPYVEALTIGNEPVLYSHIPWYRALRGDPIPWYETAGRPVFARPASYDAAQFEREWSRAAAAVPAGVPLAGPDLGTLSWLDSFERRLSPRSRVRYITVHAYPLSVCDPNPGSLAYPSVPDLLTVFAATAFLDGLGPRIALAHRYGAKFLIDEMGSISCNGRAGVSDTLASALWLLDALFATDAAGIDGVQLHTFSGLPNDLFDFTDGPAGWRGMVRPLYYGALMFTQAAPPGSRLLSTFTGDPATLRAWATVAPDRRLRVTLIDDSLSTPVNAVVRLSSRAAAAPAALERLQASSAYATQGITLGGHGFGALTATGVLPPALPLTVAPSGRAYRLRLAPGSAALLTIPAPASAHRSRR